MIFKINVIAVVILLIISFPVQGNSEPEQADSSGFFNPKTISLAAVSGIYAGSLIDSYLVWWRDDRRKFSVMNSSWLNEYTELGIDKLGHFFTSYIYFKVQKDIFLLGGYEDDTADLLSGSLTIAMALIIEVGDGYSKYGFDIKDLLANFGGLGYAYLQQKIPFMNNFNFKWSYFPTEGFQFPPRFSKHYDGHIYWLTVNINALLPKGADNIWPDFLHPAMGYSVGNEGTNREFMIGLHLDIYSLIKSENKYIDFAGKTLNLFHIPMPGIKMYENKKPEYKILLYN